MLILKWPLNLNARKYSNRMAQKLKFCSSNIKVLRKNSQTNVLDKKKNSLENLKKSATMMPMHKLIKRLNLRKKCRFSRSVWKT